jgi:WD40 repeat protein
VRTSAVDAEVIPMAANLDQLKVVKEVSRSDIVFALARMPGTSRLFFGSSDFKVYDIDLAEPKPEAREIGAHTSYVTGLALAGNKVVSGSYDGCLIWWDVDKRSQIRTVEAHAKWIRRVVATRDGQKVASVGDDMVCRLWEAGSGKPLCELRGHQEKTPHHYPSMLFACAFAQDGKYVATGDKVGHIVVWETASGKQAATLETPIMYTWDPVQRRHSIGGIRSLAFSPDGNLLAAGGIGKIGNIDHLEGKAQVEVFDWKKGQRTHEFASDKFKGLVEHLQFHPQDDWLLGAGGARDGFLQFFDLKDKKILRQDKAAMHVHDLALNEEADTFFVAGHGKILVYAMKG